MESSRINAVVEAFIQKGLEGYGHIDTPGSYAWLTSLIMTYGVELTYKDLITSDSDFQANNLLNNDAMLGKILSTGPRVRKLRIGVVSITDFKAAFKTQAKYPSLKEVHLVYVNCGGAPLRLNDYTAFKNLCSLHISAIDTEPAYGEHIASYIARNKYLKELTLGTSCVGDEGMVALVEALKVNDTLKRFSLRDIETALSYDTLISFAKILSSKSTLELVSLHSIYTVEEAQVSSCLDQDLYPGAFNKLDIAWPQSLFNELTALIRKQGCAPVLHISVPPWAGTKGIRQFFEALVPVTALRELHLWAFHSISDAYADGIAYLLKRTVSLREMMISTRLYVHREHHVINIFEALKRNRSVAKFEIKYSVLTPRMAASLSELITVNSTLNDLTVIFDGALMPEPVKVVEKGFDANYTLTKLFLGRYDEVMGDIPRLLNRNIIFENKAALWVISGGDARDKAGADALEKVHSGTGLVEKLQMITGRTRHDALDDIQRAVDRLSE